MMSCHHISCKAIFATFITFSAFSGLLRSLVGGTSSFFKTLDYSKVSNVIMDSEATFSYTDGFVEFGAGVVIPTFDIYSDVSLIALLLRDARNNVFLKTGITS